MTTENLFEIAVILYMFGSFISSYAMHRRLQILEEDLQKREMGQKQ